jgi:hypothetical protein
MKIGYGIGYIIIGIGIIGLWTMLLLTDQVPELETEPWSIAFHIVIETTMALCAIWTGVAMIKTYTYWRYLTLFTNGLLVYSVVNSSGYYGDLGQFPMMIMFAIILGFTLVVSYLIVTQKSEA